MNNLSPIYLASRSPRRQELLAQLGIPFDELKLRTAPGRHRDVVEEALDGEPALHYVERIARTKASTGWKRMRRSERKASSQTVAVVAAAYCG